MYDFNRKVLFTLSMSVLLLASLVLWGCNQCDDRACASIHVKLDSKIVPEGGSFAFETDDAEGLTCDARWVTCNQETYDILIDDFSYRPKVITVIVFDAEGEETGRYDAEPKYGVIDQSLCDCPGAETVFVP